MDGESETIKRFHVQDGAAMKLAQQCELTLAVISGRSSPALQLRLKELGINCVRSGVENKLDALEQVLRECDCQRAEAAYIGDDLPDLAPMGRCGFPVAVANAVPSVKRIARYVTRRHGGHGAVAEVIEYLLRVQRWWQTDRLTHG